MSADQKKGYTPISAVYPGLNNFLLKAKIISKSQIKEFNSKKSNDKVQVFSVDIKDEEGAEINCSFFGKACDTFFEKLEQEKVYEFLGGIVRMNTGNKQSKNDYQLSFDVNSQITEVDDDGTIKGLELDIVKIQDIKDMAKESVIDICGIIETNNQPEEVLLKSGEKKLKQSLYIYDDSHKKIEITLWGNQTQRNDLELGSVLCVKGCRVNQFKDQKQLQLGFASQIFVNKFDIIPQAQELKEWRENNQGALNIEAVGGGDYNGPIGDRHNPVVSLREIEQMAQNMKVGDKAFNQVRGYITFVKSDGNIYYKSCNQDNCAKKVSQKDNQDFFCDKHGTVTDIGYKYLTSIKLVDDNTFLWLSLYDKIGQELFGCSAKEIHDMLEEKKMVEYRELTGKQQFSEKLITILSKVESYQGEIRIKHQITKIDDKKADQAKETLDLIKQIKQYDLSNYKSKYQ